MIDLHAFPTPNSIKLPMDFSEAPHGERRFAAMSAPPAIPRALARLGATGRAADRRGPPGLAPGRAGGIRTAGSGRLPHGRPPRETIMALSILIFYGSYRSDRMGIRLADFIVAGLAGRGHAAALVDSRAVGLPMLDRMFKEHEPGTAPPAMADLAAKIRAADGFVFVTGEYNWGVQPGLKNLTDHFLEEWFWRPAAIASYSAGRTAGVRGNIAWHATLSEMGMVVISSALAVGGIGAALDDAGTPTGEGGAALAKAFPRFAADLEWWAEAGQRQRAATAPPY